MISRACGNPDIQATSKGSDQTVHVRRLVWAFAGHTYHIVGNLIPQLSSLYSETSTCRK